MKRCLVFFICFVSANCFANIPASLKNGNASYQQVLNWSKEKFIQEAKGDYNGEEIQNRLKDFPVTVKDSCGTLKLLFIKNTPQCGNVNCKYLVFSEVHSSYRYLSEMSFASERLFCYPASNNFYLVTSEHETNASSLFALYDIVQNTLVRKAEKEIDYTQKAQAGFADGLWDKKISESSLLRGFKVK